MANENVFAVLKSAVGVAVHEAAKAEIEKHKKLFEIAMNEAKRNLVNQIVDTIQISATQDLPGGEYVIQIRLNGGK